MTLPSEHPLDRLPEEARQSAAAAVEWADAEDQALAVEIRAAVDALSSVIRRATTRHTEVSARARLIGAADAELKNLGVLNGTRGYGATGATGDTASVSLYGRTNVQRVTAPSVSRIIAAVIELAAQDEPLVEGLLTLRGSARLVLPAIPAVAEDWRLTDTECTNMTRDERGLAHQLGRSA
ncbi:MAG: hypothetical protein ABIQ18_47725 [Umezawaea sp.]